MVAPVAIMAVAAAVSALAQWKNSQDALNATDEERARVNALFDKMQAPNFDMRTLTPEEFKVVGTYAPDVAPYIAEVNPNLVSAGSADAMQGRDVQREALQRLVETSRAGGMGDQLLQAQVGQAQLGAAQGIQSQKANLEAQMARRGQLGSGMQYALQLAGAAQPQMQAAQMGQNQATEAYRQKLQALTGAANLGGQIRQEDVNLSSQNAGIINAFNERLAQSRRAAGLNQQNVQNEAQQYNLGVKQGTSDRNVQTRNQYQVNERDNRNRLVQQDFGNQMDIVRGKSGQSAANVNQILGAAQQKNQSIQSIGDIGVAGGAALSRQNAYDDEKEYRRNAWKKAYGTDYPESGEII